MTKEERAKDLDRRIRLCVLDIERQARMLQVLIGDSMPATHSELGRLREDLKVLFTLWCDPDDVLRERIPRFEVTLRIIKATYDFEELEAAIHARMETES